MCGLVSYIHSSKYYVENGGLAHHPHTVIGPRSQVPVRWVLRGGQEGGGTLVLCFMSARILRIMYAETIQYNSDGT